MLQITLSDVATNFVNSVLISVQLSSMRSCRTIQPLFIGGLFIVLLVVPDKRIHSTLRKFMFLVKSE